MTGLTDNKGRVVNFQKHHHHHDLQHRVADRQENFGTWREKDLEEVVERPATR